MRRLAAGLMLGAALGWASVASAARPDDPSAQFHYEADDVLTSLDDPGGRIRVHYSVEGPNAAPHADEDGDGRPDWPALVGATADEALELFEALGFRPPVAEAALDLGPLGGSEALDVYLVDFGLSADGYFGVDGCDDVVCAGHLVIEQDFEGYGYADLTEAARTVISHELFHGVQHAYWYGQPSWVAEGTAVWAERRFDEGSLDFLAFADAYLAEAWRPIDSPPPGPVPAFAYGTCVFFEHLTLSAGPQLIAALMEDAPREDPLAALDDALGEGGGSLSQAWLGFTHAAVATGERAGPDAPWGFGDQLQGLIPEAEGASLDVDVRAYPLGVRAFVLDHGGGAVQVEGEGDLGGLALSFHPIGEGGAGEAQTVLLEGEGPWRVEDLAAGPVWVTATVPEAGAPVVHGRLCVGGAGETICAGGPGSPTPSPSPAPSPSPTSSAPAQLEAGGCACAAATAAAPESLGWAALAALSLATGRRRRARAR